VSGSVDAEVKVWTASGQLLRTLHGHSGSVHSVAISHDGKYAVSGSRDATLRVWNLDSGELLQTFESGSGWVNTLAITPDGEHAVVGTLDGGVELWNLVSGEHRQFSENQSVGLAVADARIVSASTDHTVKVWDLKSLDLLQTHDRHSDRILSVAVTPDGSRAISSSKDRTICIWNLDQGRSISSHANAAQANAVGLSDSAEVFFISQSQRLEVWESKTAGKVCSFNADAPIQCMANEGDVVVCGDELGGMHFLRLVV
jgi:WD40 repeat protein